MAESSGCLHSCSNFDISHLRDDGQKPYSEDSDMRRTEDARLISVTGLLITVELEAIESEINGSLYNC